MTISAARTIVLPSAAQPPAFYQPLVWPCAQPGEDLDYSLDMTAVLSDVGGDTISAVTAELSPSGSGEASLIDLGVMGAVVSLQISGGVAGRVYLADVAVTCSIGRAFVYTPQLPMSEALFAFPPSPPPSTGFGTSITWTPEGVVFGSSFIPVASGLVASGTTPSQGITIGAWASVFSVVGAGSYCNLPSGNFSGQFLIVNDGLNSLFVQPPTGAQINGLGANVAFSLPSGTNAVFVTSAPSVQWNQ